MSFQIRVFLLFLAIALASISAAGYCVVTYTKKNFEEIEERREQAQITQFKEQFARFGNDVVQRVENIASAEVTTRLALDLAQTKADISLYANDANGAAKNQNLDFLELAAWDGTVISCAPDYSRAGHVSMRTDWSVPTAFLDKQLLGHADALLLLAVRSVDIGGKRLKVTGGQRMDEKFMATVTLPPTMRAFLYRNFTESTFEPNQLLDRDGVVRQPQRLAPLIREVQKRKEPVTDSTDKASGETFFALPLSGRNNELLAIFLIGSSRSELTLLTRRTEWFAVGFGATAFVVALPICFWCSLRVSRIRGKTA